MSLRQQLHQRSQRRIWIGRLLTFVAGYFLLLTVVKLCYQPDPTGVFSAAFSPVNSAVAWFYNYIPLAKPLWPYLPDFPFHSAHDPVALLGAVGVLFTGARLHGLGLTDRQELAASAQRLFREQLDEESRTRDDRRS